ncbi:hypothetical protein LXL04_001184 [Taraxacum kok-saghyz]
MLIHNLPKPDSITSQSIRLNEVKIRHKPPFIPSSNPSIFNNTPLFFTTLNFQLLAISSNFKMIPPSDSLDMNLTSFSSSTLRYVESLIVSSVEPLNHGVSIISAMEILVTGFGSKILDTKLFASLGNEFGNLNFPIVIFLYISIRLES